MILCSHLWDRRCHARLERQHGVELPFAWDQTNFLGRWRSCSGACGPCRKLCGSHWMSLICLVCCCCLLLMLLLCLTSLVHACLQLGLLLLSSLLTSLLLRPCIVRLCACMHVCMCVVIGCGQRPLCLAVSAAQVSRRTAPRVGLGALNTMCRSCRVVVTFQHDPVCVCVRGAHAPMLY